MRDLSMYKEIIIWGASFPPGTVEGDATSHGRAFDILYNMLLQAGYASKIIFVADSNGKVTGLKRNGIEVKLPKEILDHPQALVIINTISICSIRNAMQKMGIENDCLIIPYYFYHGTIEHKYSLQAAKKLTDDHKEQIIELYDNHDVETVRYLDIILKLREKAEDDLYDFSFYSGTGMSENYFCDEALAPKGDVTYIDVGAYTGDSIEPVRQYYGGRLKKIYAFEPDYKSIEKLRLYLRTSNIDEITSIMPCALGSKDGILSFSHSGGTSLVSSEGEDKIEQKCFDNMKDVNVIGDTMIKMDIEGAEMDALHGMENFIKTNHPYLALCIYHKEQDLLDIPTYLKSLCAGYRFFIRGGWHLECWAVPEEHFKE